MILKNPRHEVFAQHVATGESAESAMIAAGYSPTTARCQSKRLSENVGVMSRIVEIQSEVCKTSIWNAGRVLERLGEIAEAKSSDFYRPVAEWTEAMERIGCDKEAIYERSHDGVQAGESKAWDIVGYQVKIRLADKLKALELIGRHKAVDAFVQQQKGVELHLHLHAEVEARLTHAREIAASVIDVDALVPTN